MARSVLTKSRSSPFQGAFSSSAFSTSLNASITSMSQLNRLMLVLRLYYKEEMSLFIFPLNNISTFKRELVPNCHIKVALEVKQAEDTLEYTRI